MLKLVRAPLLRTFVDDADVLVVGSARGAVTKAPVPVADDAIITADKVLVKEVMPLQCWLT